MFADAWLYSRTDVWIVNGELTGVIVSYRMHIMIHQSKDGYKLYYETTVPTDSIASKKTSDKPVLFFIHGMGGDVDAWQYIRDELLKKGVPSIAMDLRGHGYSDHPRSFSAYKMDHFVEDVSAVMEKEGVKKVILVGHCYGVVIAMHFAAKYPEKLEKLILISGTYRPPVYLSWKIMKVLANGIANLGAFISPKPYKPGHSKYPKGKFHKDYEFVGLVKTISRNSLRSYLLGTKEIVNLDLESALSGIKTPTLVMVGEKDSIFPVHISKKIHENIAGSKFEIIDGGNHVIVLNNVDKVSKLIYEFLIVSSHNSVST